MGTFEQVMLATLRALQLGGDVDQWEVTTCLALEVGRPDVLYGKQAIVVYVDVEGDKVVLRVEDNGDGYGRGPGNPQVAKDLYERLGRELPWKVEWVS